MLQGAYLNALVSTGTRIWFVSVVGQLVDGVWTNIAIRWKNSGDSTSPDTPPSERGGLELYVGDGPKVELVGLATLPIKNKEGNQNFTEYDGSYCNIDGTPPPIITLGCAYNRNRGTFDHFGEGEYDELSVWNRQLIKNNSMNEMPFFLGGYSKFFKNVVFLFGIHLLVL